MIYFLINLLSYTTKGFIPGLYPLRFRNFLSSCASPLSISPSLHPSIPSFSEYELAPTACQALFWALAEVVRGEDTVLALLGAHSLIRGQRSKQPITILCVMCTSQGQQRSRIVRWVEAPGEMPHLLLGEGRSNEVSWRISPRLLSI